MRETRKQKKKRSEERRSRANASKQEILDRLLKLIGLETVFENFGPSVRRIFIKKFHPSIDVIFGDDCRDDPELKASIREIKSVIKRPLKSSYKDRDFDISLDEFLRGYHKLVESVQSFAKGLKDSKQKTKTYAKLHSLMEEANVIVSQIDAEWIDGLVSMLLGQVYEVINRAFRLDGRMISAKIIIAKKLEERTYFQFELSLHHAATQSLKYRDKQYTAFPCLYSCPEGLVQTRWNCFDLGIEGPNIDLPVYIDEHAIDQFHKRMPLPLVKSFLHTELVQSLEVPVFFPAKRGRYLVEARMVTKRIGYFVVEVFPSFIRVATFLFLTMEGTPESDCLREKIGLLRSHKEDYFLDDFVIMVASNIADDPVISRILSECGCGHLISIFNPEFKIDWVSVYSERLKRSMDIREARGGYKVGRKWIRWSDNPYVADQAANSQIEEFTRDLSLLDLSSERGLSES